MREKGSVVGSTSRVPINDGNAFGSNKMKHRLWHLKIPFPLAEAIFHLDSTGLADGDAGKPAGLRVNFEQDDLNLAACVWRQGLRCVVFIIVRRAILGGIW